MKDGGAFSKIKEQVENMLDAYIKREGEHTIRKSKKNADEIEWQSLKNRKL